MSNFMVLDLETSCGTSVHGPAAKDPNNDFFTVIAGTTPENVQVVHEIGGYLRQLPALTVKIMDQADVIVGHNLAFDLSYVLKTKTFQSFLTRGGQMWDTQIAEYLMSGQRHSFSSLAELQLIYLGKKIKESRIGSLFKSGIGADKILAARDRCKRVFALYEKYALSDGVTTLQVFAKQHAKAKSLGMLDVIKTYNNYMLCLLIVQNTGIPVNIVQCEKTLREFKLKAIDYLRSATDLIKPMWNNELGDFNVNSPKDKSAILFGGTYIIKRRVEDGLYKNGNPKFKSVDEEINIKGFGVPTYLTTEGAKKGQYATGADIVEKIYAKSKNPQLIEYCKLQRLSMSYNKMCSTYLEPFLTLSIDGLLYPNYNNTMTITSRLSSSKPNLQNVPSKGEMLLPIQGQLVAPEGWVCVSADYSQLEIYISAYLANDPQLTADLLSGVDFHVKRLSYAEDMPYSDVYKLCKVDKNPIWESKRTSAKTISYQKAYGASPKSLSITTGIDEQIIKRIFEKEDLEYPQVALFNKSVMDQVNGSKTPSLAINIPSAKKRGGKDSKQFVAGMELLPILDSEGNTRFDRNEYRSVGYYKAITGKRYSFEEVGRDSRNGITRGFSTTQTKNYHIQGTASDVQATSSAAILPLILKHPDKIKMVNEIHDSKWFLVKEKYLPQMLPIIRELMENVPKNFDNQLKVRMPFRIPVDFKIGPNFAELTEYKHPLGSLECSNSVKYNSHNEENTHGN